jgi:hypothetical protein
VVRHLRCRSDAQPRHDPLTISTSSDSHAHRSDHPTQLIITGQPFSRTLVPKTSHRHTEAVPSLCSVITSHASPFGLAIAYFCPVSGSNDGSRGRQDE